MLPKPTLSFLATKRDAELEWLLCLAAAYLVSQPRPVNFADDGRSHSQPAFLRGLLALFKRVRSAERKRAA
jgi:hypothetical protein